MHTLTPYPSLIMTAPQTHTVQDRNGRNCSIDKDIASPITPRQMRHRSSLVNRVSLQDHHLHGDRHHFSNKGCVGYFSMILLFVSGVNLVFHLLLSQTNNSSEKNNTDPNVTFGGRLKNSKLGPAAIHSLTEALSPILPFTGGRDLRRDDTSIWELILPASLADSFDSFETVWRSHGENENLSFTRILWGAGTTSEDNSKNGNEFSSGTLQNILSSKYRGGAQTTPARTKRLTKPPSRQTVLSAPEPFVPYAKIAELTLDDITDAFRYALYANRPNFDEMVFMNNLTPKMLALVDAIDEAVAKSRGADVKAAKTHTSPGAESGDSFDSKISTEAYGDIDALQFCAAMRMFAEWRILRQIPEGYKGYAVGMGLGHKDVVQNLVKVELAVFAWIEERRELLRLKQEGVKDSENGESNTIEDDELRSPTLRELLQEEIDLNVHGGKLPRLKEKSAGMGLLWVRRQLHYQTRIFANIQSGKYSSIHLAVTAAYNEVYGSYHGWAVQKIFTYSFQAAPPEEEIFKIMNPEYLKDVVSRAKMMSAECTGDNVVETSPLDTHTSTCVSETDRQDSTVPDAISGSSETTASVLSVSSSSHAMASNITNNNNIIQDKTDNDGKKKKKSNKNSSSSNRGQNPFERFGNHVVSECDKLGSHIGSEWDKFAMNVQKLIKIDKSIDNESVDTNIGARGGGGDSMSSRRGGLSGEALEDHIRKEMFQKAKQQCGVHLEVAEPLLEDLAALFAELNMDDPTKV
mmetsp:Transcript_29444/g.43649  ORF Transcript_29444/g.43649 Transcript_29444/m.43649 type:complete len:748 (+) Transcript_29444:857-3100(+)